MEQGAKMEGMTMPPSGGHAMEMQKQDKMMMHMTFFWGRDAEVLFDGWPGTSGGMYALSLILVFLIALLVEWLPACRYARPAGGGLAAGLLQTLVYTLRTGLAYLVMLAVMSFNVGVLLVAVAGHALGFLLFGSRVFEGKKRNYVEYKNECSEEG
ncbi:unnamed protein product [Victoria cruziana]